MRQDRQLRMRRNLSRDSRHAVSSLVIPGLLRWAFLSPWWLSLRLKRWPFEWIGACRRTLHHLFSNHWIIGTKYSGMFSSLCSLILSQVNSSALCSEWRLMLPFYTLGTKIVLILVRQAAFCTCFDLSSAWRAYLNSVKTELISKCLQTFAAFVHKYHVFESGGGL